MSRNCTKKWLTLSITLKIVKRWIVSFILLLFCPRFRNGTNVYSLFTRRKLRVLNYKSQVKIACQGKRSRTLTTLIKNKHIVGKEANPISGILSFSCMRHIIIKTSLMSNLSSANASNLNNSNIYVVW